MEERSSTE